MRCSYCNRPLRLLDARHPLRLLLPRCRFCGRYTFGRIHKAILAILLLALLFAVAANVQLIGR